MQFFQLGSVRGFSLVPRKKSCGFFWVAFFFIVGVKKMPETMTGGHGRSREIPEGHIRFSGPKLAAGLGGKVWHAFARVFPGVGAVGLLAGLAPWEIAVVRNFRDFRNFRA